MSFYTRILFWITCIAGLENASAQNTCTVYGNLKSSNQSAFTISRSSRMYLKTSIDTVQIHPDGTFSYRWDLDQDAAKITLNIPDFVPLTLYGVARKRLSVDYDKANEKFIYQDELGAINQAVQTSLIQAKSIEYRYKSRHLGYDPRVPGTENTLIMDSVTSDQLSNLDRHFPNQTPGELAIRKDLKTTLIFTNLDQKMYSFNNPKYYGFYQEMMGIKSSFMFKFSDLISFNDPLLLKNEAYLQFSANCFLTLLLSTAQEQGVEMDPANVALNGMKLIDRYATNTACNRILKARFVYQVIEELKDTEEASRNAASINISKYIATLKGDAEAGHIALLLTERQGALLNGINGLAKGDEAPDFTFTDREGKAVTLKSLRGKYVYIDSWFTGCSWCVKAYPYWNALVAKFSNRKDVVFLSLSWDQGSQNWKGWMDKHQIKGMGGFSAAGLADGFTKKYQVSMAPTYVLIDKAGKLISARAEGPEKIDLIKYLNP